MTALLPVPVEVGPEGAAQLSEAAARELTAAIRDTASELVALLAAAYTGRAWVPLGYPSWPAYLAGEVGPILSGLPRARRRAVVSALADTGMSARGIAALGCSDQTVRADLAASGPRTPAGVVVGMDGRRYPAAAPTARTAPSVARSRVAVVLTDAAAAAEAGITVPEVQAARRWTYQSTSATASRLASTGRLVRLAERRGGHAVWVLPEHVAGRPVLAPGQRIGR